MQEAAHLPMQKTCGAGCVPVATERCGEAGRNDRPVPFCSGSCGTPQMARDASVWATESVCSHQSPCQH